MLCITMDDRRVSQPDLINSLHNLLDAVVASNSSATASPSSDLKARIWSYVLLMVQKGNNYGQIGGKIQNREF